VGIQPFKLPAFLGLAIFSLCFLLPVKAHAYLDPGTGSYIFQMLIAGFIATAFAVKMYWKKIKSFLNHTFSKDQKARGDDA